MAIFSAAFSCDEHFTAEDLLDKARNLDDSVSRATVYRALPLLTESNLIREVDVGKDYKYYAANKDVKTFQAQVICKDCEKIFEIDAPFMEWYGKTVAEKLTVICGRPKASSVCSMRSIEIKRPVRPGLSK